MNAAGLKILTEFEGCELKAYQDTGGVWTIGYGSTRDVCDGMVISPAEAERRLIEDLREAETRVSGLVKHPLTENQRSAIECLVFNIGCGQFKNSTILRHINAGELDLAAEQFTAWVYSKGKRLNGLLRRRRAERKLFLTPDEPNDLSP